MKIEKFWKNLQVLIKIEDVDIYDNENKCTMIVALMQKNFRLNKIKNKNKNSYKENIQFRIYKVQFLPKLKKKCIIANI